MCLEQCCRSAINEPVMNDLDCSEKNDNIFKKNEKIRTIKNHMNKLKNKIVFFEQTIFWNKRFFWTNDFTGQTNLMKDHT